MHSFRKLQVYTTARELVKAVYVLLETLPPTEKFALSDQLRRAVISLPSNIAEGSGRTTTKDQAHFLYNSIRIVDGRTCAIRCGV